MNTKNERTKPSLMLRILKIVEIGGNKLPHPVILFAYGILFVVVLSAILSWLGLNVQDPRPGKEANIIVIKNLLNSDGLRYILTTLISNFVSFAPLGTVVVSFIGIGIAEKSGLIEAALKSLVQVTPKQLITMIVVFAGAISNTASELGYLVLIPLGAVVFYGFGRHPLAGLAAAFAGVSGGYSANLLLGTVDPLLSGLSQEAARFLDPLYHVGAEANWYFMAGSVLLVVLVGTLVTHRVVEPMLGKYDPSAAGDEDLPKSFGPLAKNEKKGLIYSGLFSLGFLILLYISVLPGQGILLNQKTMTMSGSPFFSSIVAFIFIFFALNGIIYGYVSKSFTKGKDIVDAMQGAMNSLSIYVVLSFFMAQFIAYFGYTNLAIVIAVSLADFIKLLGLSGSAFLIVFIFITGIINMFMGSASAKWALMAPIFIPMFMLLGFSPELTQAAYRIGDSATNIISPLMSYVALILVMGGKYVKDFGFGNLISLMLPYSLAFLFFWSIFFYVWVFVLGIPVGPASNYYVPGVIH